MPMQSNKVLHWRPIEKGWRNVRIPPSMRKKHAHALRLSSTWTTPLANTMMDGWGMVCNSSKPIKPPIHLTHTWFSHTQKTVPFPYDFSNMMILRSNQALRFRASFGNKLNKEAPFFSQSTVMTLWEGIVFMGQGSNTRSSNSHFHPKSQPFPSLPILF